MSVHAARDLIGWRMSSGSCHNYCVNMEGGENHEPPRFSIKVNVPRGVYPEEDRLLAILRLHHGATLQSAAKAAVDHCKTVCFNKLFIWSRENIYYSFIYSFKYYFK